MQEMTDKPPAHREVRLTELGKKWVKTSNWRGEKIALAQGLKQNSNDQ